MKLVLVSLLFYFHCLGGIAQTLCKGILRDSANTQPIEYANLGIMGKGVGTVSNEKGEYSFDVPDSLLGETVKISMLGYNSKLVPVKLFQKEKLVWLSQQAIALNEISVSVKKTKIKIVGNNTKTKTVSGGFKNNGLGAEIGIKVNIKHSQTHIRAVMFNINTNTLNNLPVFRLNIYTEDKNGYPGENILAHNIIINPKEKTGYVEFDLTPYSIFVSKDVFITLEWIKDLGDTRGLYFSTKLVGSSAYFRRTSQDKWQKITPIGVGLHVELAY